MPELLHYFALPDQVTLDAVYHVTLQSVTCNMGMRMTSWFDIIDIPVTGASRPSPPSAFCLRFNRGIWSCMGREATLGFLFHGAARPFPCRPVVRVAVSSGGIDPMEACVPGSRKVGWIPAVWISRGGGAGAGVDPPSGPCGTVVDGPLAPRSSSFLCSIPHTNPHTHTRMPQAGQNGASLL